MFRQPGYRVYYALFAAGLIFISLLSLHSLDTHNRLPPLPPLPPSFHETISKIIPFGPQAKAHPRWLIATVIRASDIQRRQIIRSTWQRIYEDETRHMTRFFICNPGPLWRAVIEAENATFGDIVALEHLEETTQVANTVKSIEMLKHVSRSGHTWDFVSKTDDDSFIDVETFFNTYLRPLQAGPTPVRETVVGRTVGPNANYDFAYPGGQFYTLSWDLVPLLADLHDREPLQFGHEDALIGGLLRRAGINYTHIDLSNEVAFDYDPAQARSDKSAWAAQTADLTRWVHAVGPGAINPHKMKTDEDYLKVAACFDGRGLRTADFALSQAQQNVEKEIEEMAEPLAAPVVHIG